MNAVISNPVNLVFHSSLYIALVLGTLTLWFLIF